MSRKTQPVVRVTHHESGRVTVLDFVNGEEDEVAPGEEVTYQAGVTGGCLTVVLAIVGLVFLLAAS